MSLSQDFESLKLQISAGPDRDPTWTGDALMLLIGNGRRFPGERMGQANMEHGQVNVASTEDVPTLNYLASGAADKLLQRNTTHLTRLKTSHLHVTHEGAPVQFSLDGGMIDGTELTVESQPGAMQFFVGSSYDPNPEEWRRSAPRNSVPGDR